MLAAIHCTSLFAAVRDNPCTAGTPAGPRAPKPAIEHATMKAKRFTARFVETVTTAAAREDYSDTLVRGLQLRVTAQGSKSWALRYTRKSDGRRRRVTLGPVVALGLEEARDLAKDHLASISRGADPAAGVSDRREAPTFEELAADWIERHGTPNKSPRALRDDRSMLDRHVLPEIGTMKAQEITKRDLIRLFDKVKATPDSRGSAAAKPRKLTHRPNRVFELVRAILRWAVGRDVLKVDPSYGMAPPIKKERPRERALTPDEIQTLWEALDRAPTARRHAGKGVPRGTKIVGEADLPMTRATALAMKLALVTGQRIGEVAGMAEAELDTNDTAPIWTVPGERSKNGQPNRVPLSKLALRLIGEARGLAGGADWLFPSASGKGPIDPHAPTKALERARAAIGIAAFRVHDLRRTAATQMGEMGVSPHTISLVLNHISARRGTITGAVYVQYSYDREKREALDAWGARLESIISGTAGGNICKFVRRSV